MPTEPPKGGLGRREFFATLLMGTAATLGLGTLAVRFASFLYPVVAPEEEVEVEACALESLPEAGGAVLHLPVGSIALLRKNGNVLAFSATCTHLGCIVRWQPEQNSTFYCPCHKGRYDGAGRVTSGPPPRPLPPLPAEVRDGRVFVKVKLRAPEAGA